MLVLALLMQGFKGKPESRLVLEFHFYSLIILHICVMLATWCRQSQFIMVFVSAVLCTCLTSFGFSL